MAEKKIKGRKRHIVVDHMGNLLGVTVHAANLHDTVSGIFPALYAREVYPTIRGFCADAGYRGTFVEEVKEKWKIKVDIPDNGKPKTWKIQPKRWVVERSFAWMTNDRRLSKDYEIKTDSAESIIKISHFYTLLKRL